MNYTLIEYGNTAKPKATPGAVNFEQCSYKLYEKYVSLKSKNTTEAREIKERYVQTIQY